MKAILIRTILLAMQQLGEETAKEKERLASLAWPELLAEAQAAGVTLELRGKIEAYQCTKEILQREMKKYAIAAPDKTLVS